MASHRLTQIDALRGVAALWVVLFHFTVRYGELFGHSDALPFSLPEGRLGVHLFFMISGFVILMTLDRTSSVKDFLFFRFARLYPTFWICALITFVLVSVFELPGRGANLRDAFFNITMLPNTLGAKPIDAVYWSLEVELFFYGLMAILVGLGLRRYLVLILATLVVVNGLLLALPGPVTDLPRIVKGIRLVTTMRYLHLFLFGIICYEMKMMSAVGIRSFPRPRWFDWLLLTLCLSVACIEAPISHALCTVIIGALFLAATQYELPVLKNPVLLFVGACSYPLYTIHQNVGFIVIRKIESLGISPLIAVLAALLLTLTCAWGLSRLVEIPSNRYLRSWYQRKPPERDKTSHVGPFEVGGTRV